MENLSNFVATPKLGFGEAVKKVLSNLTNVNGRSRRSEYWWYVLAATLVSWVANAVFSSVPVVNLIISIVISMTAVAVGVRRMQDSGHSGIWVYVEFVCSVILLIYMQASGYNELAMSVNPNPKELIGLMINPLFCVPAAVSYVCGIVIFIFSLFDSNIGPNKYGDSPKYVVEE